MMRPHCDRCERELVEDYPKWVEDKPRIWHIRIKDDDAMFCRACWMNILEMNVRFIMEST